MSDSVAQEQIKAFADRIMRMRAEAKAINADVREIYAEAKANGLNKTILGQLVVYLEKMDADRNAVLTSEAEFDLYLTAYQAASGSVGTDRATHTHERDAA
jgi:uncharacterized protein (UPF0335 family)